MSVVVVTVLVEDKSFRRRSLTAAVGDGTTARMNQTPELPGPVNANPLRNN